MVRLLPNTKRHAARKASLAIAESVNPAKQPRLTHTHTHTHTLTHTDDDPTIKQLSFHISPTGASLTHSLTHRQTGRRAGRQGRQASQVCFEVHADSLPAQSSHLPTQSLTCRIPNHASAILHSLIPMPWTKKKRRNTKKESGGVEEGAALCGTHDGAEPQPVPHDQSEPNIATVRVPWAYPRASCFKLEE